MSHGKVILSASILIIIGLIFIGCSKEKSISVKQNIKITPEEKDNSEDFLTPSPLKIKVIDSFVNIEDENPNIIVDLKYATTDNFVKKVVYPFNICLLREESAVKLSKAELEFEKIGYKIKIWDGYRPVYVQKIFWSIVGDSRFVANPSTGGSIHNKGCAVDMTLVNEKGETIEMPSNFDDFTEKAYGSGAMTAVARSNLNILTTIMVKSGFKTIETEWWHFEDVDSSKFQIIDIDPNLFK
ncbi:MAG TPA: M15 family metallopeptidase [Clostridiaceae bacterium]